MIRMTKRCLVLLLLFAVCQRSFAFQWKSEDVLYVTGCVGSRVTIPWFYVTTAGETSDTIYWTQGDKRAVASLYQGRFSTFGTSQERLVTSPGYNAGLTFDPARLQDNGYYRVQVTVHGEEVGGSLEKEKEEKKEEEEKKEKGGVTKQEYYASAFLLASEPAVAVNDSTHAQEMTSDDTCPIQRQITLSRGHFTSRGYPPVDVIWTDPAGQILPSSRFQDGFFYLDLHRPLPGNYTSHVTIQPVMRQCLPPASSLLSNQQVHVHSRKAGGCGEEVEEKDNEDDAIDIGELLGNVTDLQDSVHVLQSHLAELMDNSLQKLLVTMLQQHDETLTSLQQALAATDSRLQAQIQEMTSNVTQDLLNVRDEFDAKVTQHHAKDADEKLSLQTSLNALNQAMEAQKNQGEALNRRLLNATEEWNEKLEEEKRKREEEDTKNKNSIASDLNTAKMELQNAKSSIGGLQTQYSNLESTVQGVSMKTEQLTNSVNTITSIFNSTSQALTRDITGLEERLTIQESIRQCPANWKENENSCYFLNDKLSTFDQAETQCKAFGAHLVKIDSSSENTLVRALDAGNNVWIGLEDRDTDGTWSWTESNTKITPASFTAWGANQPQVNAEHCVAFPGRLTEWHDYTCTHQFKSVCEFRLGEAGNLRGMVATLDTRVGNLELKHGCGEHWQEFEGSCYKVVKTSLNWDDAQKSCRSMDAHLVSIHSAGENDFVAQIAEGQVVWLGITDKLQEGVWVWANGLHAPSYTKWSASEPNNIGSTEHCAGLYPSNNGLWNDLPCSVTRYFVCQK